MMTPATPKRRKTSPTTSVPVGGDASDAQSQEGATTPRRASYKSPTKASLSRSHPTILARSPVRRNSEGRGKLLRQEILGGATSVQSFTDRPAESTGQINAQSARSEAAAVPNGAREVSLSPLATQTPAATAHAVVGIAPSTSSQRSPVRSRQPAVLPRDQILRRTARAGAGFPAAVQGRTFPIPRTAPAEPELPPTPTQLGLSPRPQRPRGLAASSSPGGRGPRHSRLRSSQTDISSPLKPKEKVEEEESARQEFGDESMGQNAEEAPESNVDQARNEVNEQMDVDASTNDCEVPEDISPTHQALDDAKAQLWRLQNETGHLESALSSQNKDPELSQDVLALLTTLNTSCDPHFSLTNPNPTLHRLKDPVALPVNPLAFLRAFAPGDLRLTTNTKSASRQGRPHQTHVISISASPPFPPHILTASFRVICDVESARVVSITSADIQPRHGAGIQELRRWVEARLQNPLHRLDIGTIIWGMGMWWKEAVIRAQHFKHLENTIIMISKSSSDSESRSTYQPDHPVAVADVESLLPYLGKSFIEVLPAEPYSNRASTNEARKYRQPRLLLKWDVELDWSGEVHTEIGVAGAEISKAGGEGLKKVFEELAGIGGTGEHGLGAGVVRAVEEVVKILCRVGKGARKGKGGERR